MDWIIGYCSLVIVFFLEGDAAKEQRATQHIVLLLYPRGNRIISTSLHALYTA
jgi:hypothetical protein